MKAPRIGRPPLPKKLQKDSLVSLRFTAEDHRRLVRAAVKAGEKLSEWSRRALLAAAAADGGPTKDHEPRE